MDTLSPSRDYIRIATPDGPRWAVELEEQALVIDGSPWLPSQTHPAQATIVRLEDVTRLAPADPWSKIICFGKTYAGHAAEMGWERPAEPVMFLKPYSALCGPGDRIVLPPESSVVEPEGELAVIIGRRLRRATPAQAADAIFGYTAANDVSARDLMKSDGQWSRAKGFDSFLPLGPRIVTTGIDPSEVQIVTRINGEVCQFGTTADLLWSVADLVARASVAFTLNPGDVILTGSPSGRRALVAGDRVEVSLAGIGELRNAVASENLQPGAPHAVSGAVSERALAS